MSVEEIIRIVSLSVSLFISLFGFAVTLFKAIINSIKTKKWNRLETAVQGYIKDAEKFVNYSGEEKKEKVLSWATNFCQDNKIKFDKDKISSMIEELVTLTKQVNQREKDKIATEKVEIAEQPQ